MLDEDLETAELGETTDDLVDLRGMNEHTLDFANHAHLTHEYQTGRRIAARTRFGEQAEGIAWGVAYERQGPRPELRRDELASAAEFHRFAALRVEKLAEEIAGVQMHALVDTALAGERADLRLAAVIEELDTESCVQLAP